MRWRAWALIVFVTGFCTTAGRARAVVPVYGAGTEKMARLLARWADIQGSAAEPIRLMYDPLPATEAVARFARGDAFFALLDAPLAAQDLAKLRRPAVQVPLVLDAAAPASPACVLLPREARSAARSRAMRDLFVWALRDGQWMVADLGYEPLDNADVQSGLTALGNVQVASANGPEVLLHVAGPAWLAPLWSEWSRAYGACHPDVRLEYRAAGTAELRKGGADFLVADGPVSDSYLHAPPFAIAAVAVAYNLRTPGRPLRLSAGLLAAIYQGRVFRWNDPRIAAENPGVALPALPIHPLHPAPGPLKTVFRRWLALPGTSWPVGLEVRQGMADEIARMAGAIGPVFLPDARRAHLRAALLPAGGGRLAAPTAPSYPLRIDLSLHVVAHHRNSAEAKCLADLLAWGMGPGREALTRAGLVPTR